MEIAWEVSLARPSLWRETAHICWISAHDLRRTGGTNTLYHIQRADLIGRATSIVDITRRVTETLTSWLVNLAPGARWTESGGTGICRGKKALVARNNNSAELMNLELEIKICSNP